MCCNLLQLGYDTSYYKTRSTFAADGFQVLFVLVMLLLLFLFTFIIPAWTLPAWTLPTRPLTIPHVNPLDILCQLPITCHFLCPPTSLSATTRATVLGTANGASDPSGAYRFAVKYASAPRWAPSNIVTTWNLPCVPPHPSHVASLTPLSNGATNASALPLPCPQPGVDSSAFTEDCLSMVIYVPPSLNLASDAPTIMWYVILFIFFVAFNTP